MLYKCFVFAGIAVLASIHSILAPDVPRTEDVGRPTKSRVDAGQSTTTLAQR